MVHITALRDSAGNIVGAVNCFHDVTEQSQEDRAAARERAPASRDPRCASGRRSTRPTPRAGSPIITKPPSRCRAAARSSARTNGASPGSSSARTARRSRMTNARWRSRSRRSGAVRGAEAVAERPDGSRVPFIPYPTPLFDAAGEMIGAVNVLVDIGHRKEAETQQRLLFAELNHRIKNNMQTLYALLAAARRETASDDARYGPRRGGAAGGGDGGGADRALPVRQSQPLRQRRLHDVGLRGGRRRLRRQARARSPHSTPASSPTTTAVPLALILNELITNAAKYGAGARRPKRDRGLLWPRRTGASPSSSRMKGPASTWARSAAVPPASAWWPASPGRSAAASGSSAARRRALRAGIFRPARRSA